MTIRGALAEPVELSFRDRPLGEALRDLAGHHALIVRRLAKDPVEGLAPIVEIRVRERAAEAGPGRVSGGRAEPGADRALSSEPASVAEPGAGAWDWASFRAAYGGITPPTRGEVAAALESADRDERMAAALRAGSLSPPSAAAVLASMFRHEDDPRVRSRAVAALARIGGRRARLRLELTLADPDPLIRDATESALAVWPE